MLTGNIIVHFYVFIRIIVFSKEQCLALSTYFSSELDELTIEIWDVEGDKYGDLKGTKPLLQYRIVKTSKEYMLLGIVNNIF